MDRTLRVWGLVVIWGCNPARDTPRQRQNPVAAQAPKATAEIPSEVPTGNRPWLQVAEEHWEARIERDELEKAIAAWEAALETDGTRAQTLVMLARAHHLLADGYMRLSEEEGILDVLEKGVAYAERALMAASPAFAAEIESKKTPEEAAAALGPEAVAAAYWYAATLGRFASNKGFTTQLFYKDRIFTVMRRVLDLDPDFFFGAPHRFFGAYYVHAPAFAGGDVMKSQEHFRIALKAYPHYLGTKVLYAQYYARRTGDRSLFVQLLDEVLEADAEALPELVAENHIEQLKARALKARVDELF